MMKGGLGALMKQAQQMQENMRKAQAATQAKMSGFTAGLNLPPGMGLPF